MRPRLLGEATTAAVAGLLESGPRSQSQIGQERPLAMTYMDAPFAKLSAHDSAKARLQRAENLVGLDCASLDEGLRRTPRTGLATRSNGKSHALLTPTTMRYWIRDGQTTCPSTDQGEVTWTSD
jgi:hypothetical protein